MFFVLIRFVCFNVQEKTQTPGECHISLSHPALRNFYAFMGIIKVWQRAHIRILQLAYSVEFPAIPIMTEVKMPTLHLNILH